MNVFMNARMNATTRTRRMGFRRAANVVTTPWKPRRASFFPCAVRYRNMNH